MQWSATSTFATKWEDTVTGGSTTDYKINPTPALTADTRYYVRVIAVKLTGGTDDSAPSDAADTKTSTGDYDADNDGLIEISNLAQLNAVRWDLDGDGGTGDGDDHLQLGVPER